MSISPLRDEYGSQAMVWTIKLMEKATLTGDVDEGVMSIERLLASCIRCFHFNYIDTWILDGKGGWVRLHRKTYRIIEINDRTS